MAHNRKDAVDELNCRNAQRAPGTHSAGKMKAIIYTRVSSEGVIHAIQTLYRQNYEKYQEDCFSAGFTIENYNHSSQNEMNTKRKLS